MLGSMVILLIGLASHDHPPITENDLSRVVLTAPSWETPWAALASRHYATVCACSQQEADDRETPRPHGRFSSFPVSKLPDGAIAHSKGLRKLLFPVAFSGELLCSHSGTLCYGRRRYV